MNETVLLTGGLGFIGSHLVTLLRRRKPDCRIINLDLGTYAADPSRLNEPMPDAHYRLVQGDIADASLVGQLLRDEQVTLVVNCAAETHVDRSIEDAAAFVHSNILGTQVLLDAARAARVRRFLQVSTDEVYGSLGMDDAPFTERSSLLPRSPYSASKAAADLLVLAQHSTYRMDVVITRASNTYGPTQHPEKLIPFMITAALEGRPLPVYGDGLQRRDWLHVEDHCAGILAALERGTPGTIYNLGSGEDRANTDVIQRIAELLGVPAARIQHVTDRPGHDRRYAIDSSHARAQLGWQPMHTFDDGLAATVTWYRDHAAQTKAVAASAHQASDARIARWAQQ